MIKIPFAKIVGSVVALTYSLTPSPTLAVSWEQAITSAEKTADEYWEEAQARGAGLPGTAYNEIGIPEHECAILGRLFGKTELIEHLERIERPETRANMTEEEVQGLLVTSILFSNWAHTAKRILNLSKGERISIWNLNCVGRMQIEPNAFIQEVGTEFRVEDATLTVLGGIHTGFYERFSEVLDRNPQVTDVILGSGGGSVLDALKSGQLIRSRALNTSLYADCLSACPLVFLGGSQHRTIWSPYPRLGFHRVSRSNNQLPDQHEVYDLIFHYTQQMGSNPISVVAWMQSAEINDMHFPEFDDLCEANFVTGVQRWCLSER